MSHGCMIGYLLVLLFVGLCGSASPPNILQEEMDMSNVIDMPRPAARASSTTRKRQQHDIVWRLCRLDEHLKDMLLRDRAPKVGLYGSWKDRMMALNQNSITKTFLKDYFHMATELITERAQRRGITEAESVRLIAAGFGDLLAIGTYCSSYAHLVPPVANLIRYAAMNNYDYFVDFLVSHANGQCTELLLISREQLVLLLYEHSFEPALYQYMSRFDRAEQERLSAQIQSHDQQPQQAAFVQQNLEMLRNSCG